MIREIIVGNRPSRCGHIGGTQTKRLNALNPLSHPPSAFVSPVTHHRRSHYKLPRQCRVNSRDRDVRAGKLPFGGPVITDNVSIVGCPPMLVFFVAFRIARCNFSR